ncbi:MAG: hypothetical protein R2708_13635 [Vicinamibacterales bacterium]
MPSANVSGDQPGDIAAVEVYAVTADDPPRLETGVVPPAFSLISSARVRRPLPPLPPGAPAEVPAVPREPGLDQGARTTVRERLTPELQVPPAVAGGERLDDRAAVSGSSLARPLLYADGLRAPKRHYAAVAVSRRGRRGPWSAVTSVPVGPVSGAPSAPALTYDAAALTLAWAPAPDARRLPAPAPADVLESRTFGPTGDATRYNVYALETAAADPALLGPAARLNEAPLAETTFSVAGVTFGQARCFVVRGVDTLDEVDVEGPASPAGCVTPVDTFPPPAPTALEAVGGAGVVSLIWEGVDATDLAGYLVFRGEAGGAPTTQLTPAADFGEQLRGPRRHAGDAACAWSSR